MAVNDAMGFLRKKKRDQDKPKDDHKDKEDGEDSDPDKKTGSGEGDGDQCAIGVGSPGGPYCLLGSTRVVCGDQNEVQIDALEVGDRVARTGLSEYVPQEALVENWLLVDLQVEAVRAEGEGACSATILVPASDRQEWVRLGGGVFFYRNPMADFEGWARVSGIRSFRVQAGAGNLVTGIFRSKVQEVYKLKFDGREVCSTASHLFQLSDGAWLPACDLRPGDSLLNARTGRDVALGEVVRINAQPEESFEVYDLLVDGDASFVLEGGLVAHNASCRRRGGRLGNQATREHIEQVAKELEARGWKVTGGGGEFKAGQGRLKEEYLPGPGGQRKGSNWLDITATKGDKTIRINTVDTLADGVTPTRRELEAAAKIRQKDPGVHLILIPKPK